MCHVLGSLGLLDPHAEAYLLDTADRESTRVIDRAIISIEHVVVVVVVFEAAPSWNGPTLHQHMPL